jgi:uncharacterized membrane protein YfcA
MIEQVSLDFLSSSLFWQGIGVFAVGVIASFVNAVAGGGSTLSLPFFLFLGFPSAVAHGTNRAGLLAGAGSATWSMYRHKQISRSLLVKILPSILMGTVLGTFITIQLPDFLINPLVGLTMILITYSTIVKDRRQYIHETTPRKKGNVHVSNVDRLDWKQQVLLFLVGLYGGVIQVGMGLVMMGCFSRIFQKENNTISLSIYEVNGLKVSVGFVLLLVSLCIFISKGLVFWEWVVVYGLGAALGGWVGVKWQLTAPLYYVKWFVRVMGLLLGGWLLLSSWTHHFI